MVEIFVVGSFVAGVTIRVPRMPVLGEALLGDAFDMGIGGKGTNQAIAAGRLGAKVHLLACVGDDAFGTMVFECLEREGLSHQYIHRVPGVPTGMGMVGVLPSGENWIIGHLGANGNLRPQQVDLAEKTIAHCSIVMTQFEVPLETMARAMELGRNHGVMTLLNPAPGRRVEKDMLKNVDILTPNESETRILLGLPPDDPTPIPELALRLLDFGVKTIVVTRGRYGSLIVTPRGCREVLPVKVNPVDVTGAGDCFNAALAVGLGNGLTLDKAVENANYAGAYATQFMGVINGLPTAAQLETFKESIK